MSRVRARAEARARSRAARARVLLTAAVLVCALAGVLVVVLGRDAPAPASPGSEAPVAVDPGAVTRDGVVDPRGERATVVGVADPVTLDVRLPGRDVVRVRALGVQPGEQCYAEESLAFARRILGGSEVALVPGPLGPVTDPFDRRLLQVVLDGNDYAVLAANAGVAQTYAVGAAEAAMVPIRDAEQRARAAGRGLWSAPCG